MLRGKFLGELELISFFIFSIISGILFSFLASTARRYKLSQKRFMSFGCSSLGISPSSNSLLISVANLRLIFISG